ncbi:MAG: MerR family DNA-binding transcriptional regulator [Granulosicoccus sp.]
MSNSLISQQTPAAQTPSSWTITELSREFGITTRTIRFYEDRGLLRPARRGQQRIYSRSDRTRLKLVLRGKRLGWPLDDIREMIELYETPDGEQKQLDLMLERITQSRDTLLQQRDDINLALSEFDEIETRCKKQLSTLTRRALP